MNSLKQIHVCLDAQVSSLENVIIQKPIAKSSRAAKRFEGKNA